MKSVEIQGNVRTEVGSKYAKAERKAGNVPCVVYGGEAPIHFSAPTLAFRGLVYTAEAKTAKITVGDTTVEAVIQDIQFHPVTDQLMHIDFIQLVDGKAVTMNIPVVLHGQARGVLNGGKLKTILRQLSVRADVTPEGFEILNADTAVIVTVKKARGAVDEDDDEEEEGAEGAEAPAEAAAAE